MSAQRGVGAREQVRVQVYDGSSATMVRDVVLPAHDWSAAWDGTDQTHELRARLRHPEDGGWGDPGPWIEPPLDFVLGPRRSAPPALDPQAPPGALLLFTIDTECSVLRMRDPDPSRVVDELVFGGPAGAGIGLHMDLLEHVGARGCFFLDVLLEHTFGRAAVERVVDAILSRGHEIQLHIHADHLRHADDPGLRKLANGTRSQDGAVFPALLEHSVELFERRVGVRPIAYRAGAYRISDAHFAALAAQGVRIDASVQTWFNADVSDWMRARTQPHWVDGVLETPVTWFLREDEREGGPSPRAFAPGALTGGAVLDGTVPGREPFVATLVSHSFQLLRAERHSDGGFRDRWMKALERSATEEDRRRFAPPEGYRFTVHDGTPDETMIVSAARVLRQVAERPDARCVTYAELCDAATAGDWWRGPRAAPTDPVPVFDGKRGWSSRRAIRVSHAGDPVGADVAPVDLPTDVRGRNVLWVGPRTGVADTVEAAAWRLTAVPRVAPAHVATADLVLWSPALDLRPGRTCAARLRDARSGCRPGGALVVGVEVLAAATARDLLVPTAGGDDRLPVWDVPTYQRWLAGHGVTVAEVVRARRAPDALALLAAHPARLGPLAPLEVETATAWLTVGSLDVRRGAEAEPETPVGEPTSLDGERAEVVLGDLRAGDPEELGRAVRAAYSRLRPGGTATATLGLGGPCSSTTVLAALQRTGFEIVGPLPSGVGEVTLARPFELEDIQRYVAAMP